MTDRIEAIRARHAARLEPKHDDVAFLLASADRVSLILDNVQRQASTLRDEVERLQSKRIEDARLLHIEINRRDEALRKLWDYATDPDMGLADFNHAAGDLLGEWFTALAPVAPDAEPGGAACGTCGGSGVIREQHDGGDHPVHCPCTYRPKEPTC